MDEPDSTLSFVDTLCCGLGGMILLFLIFCLLPQVGVDETTDNSIESMLQEHRQAAKPTEQVSSDSPALFKLTVSGAETKDLRIDPSPKPEAGWRVSEIPRTEEWPEEKREFLFFFESPGAQFFKITIEGAWHCEIEALHFMGEFEEGVVYNRGAAKVFYTEKKGLILSN